MNDRPMLFENIHFSLQNYYTRNSRFNLYPVRLDVENVAIFQSIKCFNTVSAQLFVLICNYKKILLESNGR